MGCSLSADAPGFRTPDEEEEDEDDAVQVSLSTESWQVIRQSWREIQEDISRVGVIMFIKIMSFIEKTVTRIDQDKRLDQLILDLGRKHYRYNALPKYYEVVGAEFIRAVQPILKQNLSSELKEAWKTLFLYITCIMKRGFQQEQRHLRHT